MLAIECCQCYLPVIYFQFPIQFAFSISEARRLQWRTWFTQYQTSDVAENIWSAFRVRGLLPMERLWIDSNKMAALCWVNTIQYSPWSGPLYVIGGFLGPPVSSMQKASWSLQSFLQGSLGDGPTDRPRYSVGNNRRSVQWRSQILL